MPLLTDSEFKDMERLLAGLLISASGREEEALLCLHARLKGILASQQDLRGAKEHLLSLTRQTEQ